MNPPPDFLSYRTTICLLTATVISNIFCNFKVVLLLCLSRLFCRLYHRLSVLPLSPFLAIDLSLMYDQNILWIVNVVKICVLFLISIEILVVSFSLSFFQCRWFRSLTSDTLELFAIPSYLSSHFTARDDGNKNRRAYDGRVCTTCIHIYLYICRKKRSLIV